MICQTHRFQTGLFLWSRSQIVQSGTMRDTLSIRVRSSQIGNTWT